MNQTFDFNEIFAGFNFSFPIIPQTEEKSSSQNIQTFSEYTFELQEDESLNEPILELQQPRQINHIWLDNQQDPMIQKMIHHSRKDTADCEEICQQKLSKKERRKLRFNETQKNQTKNIPKNFGKAILAFIQNHKKLVKAVMEQSRSGTVKDLMQFLNQHKKEITTISDLRSLWIDNPFQSVIRTLSCVFLRRYSLNYIFNSRVCNYVSHIKYRQRFLEAIQAPNEFKHIKDF